MHIDPKLWANPEEFRPERFLDDSGQLRQLEHYMPFGLGKTSTQELPQYLWHIHFSRTCHVVVAKTNRLALSDRWFTIKFNCNHVNNAHAR